MYAEVAISLQNPTRNRDSLHISKRNKLLLTLLWLRTYPHYSVLSSLFNINIQRISEIISRTWPILHHHYAPTITWPTRREWRQMKGNWSALPDAVGAIDGTSHRIYRPSSEEQRDYYSGHRHCHCIHTQIVIDNLKIRRISSGFLGHNNDTQTYRMMPPIGPGRELDFPHDTYLLGDTIYIKTPCDYAVFSSTV